jgi:hypothetical protein
MTSMDPRRIAEVGQSIDAQVAEVTARIQSRSINLLHLRLFDMFKLQDLQVQQGSMDTAELRATKQIALEERHKTLVDALSVARENAIKKEGQLARATSEGAAIAGAALMSQVEAAQKAVAGADAQLRAFLNSSTPFGTIGDLLKLNVDKELASLSSEDAKFQMQERNIAGDENEDRKEKLFDKNMVAITKAIDKKVEEDPFAAMVMGIPLKRDAVARYREQIAENQKLMVTAGFGGATGLDQLAGSQFDQLFLAWQRAVSRMPKAPKRQLQPGEQFTVPPDVQANLDAGTHEAYSGKGPGLLDSLFGGESSTKKQADEAKRDLTVIQQAYQATFSAINNATNSVIDQMITRHKSAAKEVKKALVEPLVTYLEGLGITAQRDAFKAFSDGNIAKGIAEEAASLFAFSGAALISSLGGSGGGGGGGGGAGDGEGSGSNEHRNAGANLGRGSQDGGPLQMEIVVTQKSEDGRQLAQTRQKFQRLDDLNQPNRLVL